MANRNPSPATRFRTGKEQERLARKAGQRSGEVRRSLQDFRQTFQGEITDEMREELFWMLYNRALHGNLRAFEILRDTMGEKPAQKISAAPPADSEVISEVEAFLEGLQDNNKEGA